MIVAVVGSRTLEINDLGRFLPDGVTEIVSGGAKGVDTSAREFAKANGIKLTEVLPDYRMYGKGAPLKRNEVIVDMVDLVIAFWDGKSRGTKHVIDLCCKKGKPVKTLELCPNIPQGTTVP